jgi:hypothetical protein
MLRFCTTPEAVPPTHGAAVTAHRSGRPRPGPRLGLWTDVLTPVLPSGCCLLTGAPLHIDLSTAVVVDCLPLSSMQVCVTNVTVCGHTQQALILHSRLHVQWSAIQFQLAKAWELHSDYQAAITCLLLMIAV